MVYSLEHNTFIIKSYYRNGVFANGEWSYSIVACKNEFRTTFPNFEIQDKALTKHIKEIVDRFSATGSVQKGKSTGRPGVSAEVVEDLRERMEENPRTSLRRLSLQADVPLSTCRKVIKNTLHLYPYRITSVQELLPGDPIQRVEYCNWFQANLMNNNNLLYMTFYSDEAWFHLSGYVNSKNYRIWSAENPHVFVETPLHPLKIGVWIAVSRRRLVGPIFFHDTINAGRYQEILTNFINQLDEDEIRHGYFQHDGATAHTARTTIAFIRRHFGNRIISRGTDIPYPARSPDLTPLDFSIFGTLKNSVFRRRMENLEDLRQAIIDCCAEIDQVQLQNIFENKKRRVVKCLEKNGEHFEMFM